MGEFAHGHIDGFFNIPVDELRERLGELDKRKPVYVICQSGLRSYIACRILAGNGFDCYNFSGGFRFYDAVTNDRCLIESATACGMGFGNHFITDDIEHGSSRKGQHYVGEFVGDIPKDKANETSKNGRAPPTPRAVSNTIFIINDTGLLCIRKFLQSPFFTNLHGTPHQLHHALALEIPEHSGNYLTGGAHVARNGFMGNLEDVCFL